MIEASETEMQDMTPDDYPKEFEEDFISLDTYRNHRIKTVFPDPRIEEIIRGHTHSDLIKCALAGIIAFLGTLWSVSAFAP